MSLTQPFVLHVFFFRVVNNTSSTPAAEIPAPSSTGSSAPEDSRPEPAGDSKEEGNPAELLLTSQSQHVEDKDKLDTKKDQQCT